ncbi:uncharacterized protein EV422DRAFT_348198 [Fimicolochytrium jonesii]|uniref:uncharacterized protein n=1 Tax=Fimicolochytrium jonesii TaxID=1396493 RepID=UPI0022FDF226|nr:uncharacterized protein EV422DRAFT_348198 [Fimicolochytrium jonesii]KAI8815668.1 hypothetical protein EV422DRAFT_348198 [Fimicolochytrium jonesii]
MRVVITGVVGRFQAAVSTASTAPSRYPSRWCHPSQSSWTESDTTSSFALHLACSAGFREIVVIIIFHQNERSVSFTREEGWDTKGRDLSVLNLSLRRSFTCDWAHDRVEGRRGVSLRAKMKLVDFLSLLEFKNATRSEAEESGDIGFHRRIPRIAMLRGAFASARLL